ncbi:hypothetical protein FRC09_004499 [Ceratobasidium sp. 395]|nr:hypothetical protein FRC09_004499 [Ceratobasidium sp. 395]
MDLNLYKIRRAQETHTAVQGRRTCDCNQCYGKVTKGWHYKTVEDYRNKYGRHVEEGENAPLDPQLLCPLPL